MARGDDASIRAALALVREFQGSDVLVHVCGLLDELEAGYKEQLADVAAADLSRLQGALKQVKHLRKAILEGASPRL